MLIEIRRIQSNGHLVIRTLLRPEVRVVTLGRTLDRTNLTIDDKRFLEFCKKDHEHDATKSGPRLTLHLQSTVF